MKMTLRLQHRDGEQRTWMRWIALLCMLLIMVASTVELTHTHPDAARPLQKQGQTAPTDHCPLCVAMHSALPTALQAAPEPVMMVGTVQGPAIDTRRRLLWAHGLASRPPPAHTLIAL